MALDTFYIPTNTPNLINFPVLRSQQANINALMTYALRVSSALADYNSGKYNKIDLNMGELQQNIDLCRSTCYTLGTASSIPFDVLVELRKFQDQFQNVMTIYRVKGAAVVGTPTSTTTTTTQGGGV